MWSEYESEFDLETVAARVELLLSLAARLSWVEWFASRLEVFEDDFAVLSEALADLLASNEDEFEDDLLAAASREAEFEDDLLAAASSESEFEDDLLAEAFRAALADFESLAERLLLEELSWLLARLPLELEVSADVPAVVLLPFEAVLPLVPVRLFAVVPLEDELSLPLVAALL